MKIKPEHFGEMRLAMLEAMRIRPLHRDALGKGYIKPRRYRWDMLYAAKFKNPDGGSPYSGNSYLCLVLYEYLKDDHIDTALKNIVALNLKSI